MPKWNLWHGCHKISLGCANCYVYRIDEKYGRDSGVVTKNQDFNLPVRRTRTGEYKIPSGEMVYTCFTSDYFLEDADCWREETWRIIKEREDLEFLIITKRIHRFLQCVPKDWANGYPNVHIYCTVENQDRADFRLPLFLEAPIRHKGIVCEPLLEKINLSPYLFPCIEEVIAGGESGRNARLCDYQWVLDIRRQCIKYNVPFHFKQTGALFRKDGAVYRIPRTFQHAQARKAAIDYRWKEGKPV